MFNLGAIGGYWQVGDKGRKIIEQIGDMMGDRGLESVKVDDISIIEDRVDHFDRIGQIGEATDGCRKKKLKNKRPC